VRNREAIGRQLEVADEEQVDVEGARPVTRPAGHSPALDLDRLAHVQELGWPERGAHPGDRVQEVPLVEHLPDRLGLVQGRDRLNLDATLAERGERRPKVALAIADVRAQAQVSD
jgi:hypothetical protein